MTIPLARQVSGSVRGRQHRPRRPSQAMPADRLGGQPAAFQVRHGGASLGAPEPFLGLGDQRQGIGPGQSLRLVWRAPSGPVGRSAGGRHRGPDRRAGRLPRRGCPAGSDRPGRGPRGNGDPGQLGKPAHRLGEPDPQTAFHQLNGVPPEVAGPAFPEALGGVNLQARVVVIVERTSPSQSAPDPLAGGPSKTVATATRSVRSLTVGKSIRPLGRLLSMPCPPIPFVSRPHRNTLKTLRNPKHGWPF